MSGYKGMNLTRVPWRRWLIYTLLAFGGSAIYGASLSVLFPRWNVSSGALWVILSAGLGWLVLGLGLLVFYRKKIDLLSLIHISLKTMSFGIYVLLGGTFINLCLLMLPDIASAYFAINLGVIIVSNIVMAYVFAKNLSNSNVPIVQALLLWLLLLDGSGLLFFVMFARWLA